MPILKSKYGINNNVFITICFTSYMIIITRHGETYLNQENRYQTVTDNIKATLTQTGLEQSLKKKRILQKDSILFSQVFCSPKQRAVQTAKKISNLPLNIIPELQDINLSPIEGLTAKEAAKLYPDQHEKYQLALKNLNWDFKFTTENAIAESKNEVFKRVKPIIDKLNKSQKTSLIVSHSVTSKIILAYFYEKLGFGKKEDFSGEINNEDMYKITNSQILKYNYQTNQFEVYSQD